MCAHVGRERLEYGSAESGTVACNRFRFLFSNVHLFRPISVNSLWMIDRESTVNITDICAREIETEYGSIVQSTKNNY